MQQSDSRQRGHLAKLVAAIAGLIAMLAMAVTFASVASSTAAKPGIQPEPKPMQMGATMVMKTPPTTPTVESAHPMVKAPRPTA